MVAREREQLEEPHSVFRVALYAELPVSGHYFWDLFPGFLIGGIGLALGFVPLTIGALAGVRPGSPPASSTPASRSAARSASRRRRPSPRRQHEELALEGAA